MVRAEHHATNPRGTGRLTSRGLRARFDRCTTGRTPLGSVTFKNVGRAVPIYSVLAADAPASLGAVDPVCRMKLARPRVTVDHRGRVFAFCSNACADRFRASPEAF